jgi:putative ABC transport system substrate-binding protein
MIARRPVIGALASAVLAAPFAAGAQSRAGASSPATILVVGATPASLAVQGLHKGLMELGYVEGRDVSMPFFDGELVVLLPELERRRVDVLFAIASKAVIAARRATRTVPIIAVDLETEPVTEGLIRSFARPGGNLTGFFLDQSTLAAKWLQLIVETVPGASRLAVLRDLNLASAPWWAIEAAARNMKVELRGFAMDVPTLEGVFADIAEFSPNMLVILSSPLVVVKRTEMAALALKARLPSIALFRVYAEAGGLMSYGPDPYVMGGQAAIYMDKILKGAKPADLPVQQPTRFELVINLKTARALGLTMPPLLLAQADEVIE